jgi:hypothetical protein
VKNKSLIKNIFGASLVAIMLFFVYLMARITIPYFSFRTDIDFLLTKQAIIHLSIWRQAFYIHIATSTFVLLAGTLQFIKPILRKRPKLHRQLGKFYVFLVLVFSAPGGFVMALFANGGLSAKISFVITATLWWIVTFLAYRNAREKKFKQHIAYMYRSYALTLTAITFRLYVFILPHFIHMHSTDMYCFITWLSWIPNVIVAELLIRKWKLRGSLVPGRV